MSPRIFISHGAGRDPEVQQVLDILAPALDERGYEVFVDVEGLRIGDDWNRQLYREMYRCDAAVVLLGPNTVGMGSDDPSAQRASEWVRRESEVLVGRYKAGGLRAVFPGLVGQLTTSVARRNGFGTVLSLQAAQALGALAEDLGSAPEVVATRILDEIAPVTPMEPGSDSWARRVANLLRTAWSVNEDGYIAAAEAAGLLKEDLFHIRSKIGSELFLAQRLLSGELHSKLPDVMAQLRPGLSGEQLRHLADEVLPAWVDHRAACLLTGGATVTVPGPRAGQPVPADDPATAEAAASSGQVVVLDVWSPWTAEQYVQRSVRKEPGAYRLQTEPEHLPADERPVTEALEELCRGLLRQVFSVPPGMPVNAATVRANPAVRNFLVLRAGGRGSHELATVANALQRDFPWLTVVTLTAGNRDCTEEALRASCSARVVTVRPPLPVAEERAAYELKCLIDGVVTPGGVPVGCH
ncbi:toll/interleukin-1 receptor domain-containing protein [Kitasatospora sp. NPDC001664]